MYLLIDVYYLDICVLFVLGPFLLFCSSSAALFVLSQLALFEHGGCQQSCAFTHGAAVNILEHVSFCTSASISVDKFLQLEISCCWSDADRNRKTERKALFFSSHLLVSL